MMQELNIQVLDRDLSDMKVVEVEWGMGRLGAGTIEEVSRESESVYLELEQGQSVRLALVSVVLFGVCRAD